MKLILFILSLLMASCSYPYWDIIDDPIDEPVTACSTYVEVTQPEFSCFFLNLDLPLTDTTFYYGSTPIDENVFFTNIYYSGINIGGVINGSNTTYNGKIWVRDGSGAKHYLAFYSQGLYFRGAVTFDQFWNELISKPSVRLLSFTNTAFTCDEYVQILNFLLEDCKEGRWRIMLGGVTCIPQSIIDELIERGWEVIP